MGVKVEETSGIGSLFGDSFNERVVQIVKERLPKSHDMFKSIRVVAKYENKQLTFEFTRHNDKRITTKQRESINEKFQPILKQAIREAQAEFNK